MTTTFEIATISVGSAIIGVALGALITWSQERRASRIVLIERFTGVIEVASRVLREALRCRGALQRARQAENRESPPLERYWNVSKAVNDIMNEAARVNGWDIPEDERLPALWSEEDVQSIRPYSFDSYVSMKQLWHRYLGLCEAFRQFGNGTVKLADLESSVEGVLGSVRRLKAVLVTEARLRGVHPRHLRIASDPWSAI